MKTEPEKKAPDHLQQEADRTRPHKKMSVLGYITILFAAAFLLLLMSYLMQQRNNEEVISGLKESASAMQSIENLQDEKKDLTQQVQQLQQQLSDKTQAQEDAQKSSEKLEQQLNAMDWLREIESLYAKKYFKSARTMIAAFEDTGLPAYLPDTPLHSYNGSDVLSPLEQYQKIVEALD